MYVYVRLVLPSPVLPGVSLWKLGLGEFACTLPVHFMHIYTHALALALRSVLQGIIKSEIYIVSKKFFQIIPRVSFINHYSMTFIFLQSSVFVLP